MPTIVKITEKKTGKTVEQHLVLAGQNYTPSEKMYFDEAWEAAVSDKTVDANRRDDYSFEIK